MRSRFSPIFWIVVVALVSQGGLPGVVLCVEATGNVEFETIGDKCCSPEPGDARSTTVALYVSPLHGTDSCGPCIDMPVSTGPSTRPQTDADADLALPIVAHAMVPSVNEPIILTDRMFVATDANLLFLRTTTLLI